MGSVHNSLMQTEVGNTEKQFMVTPGIFLHSVVIASKNAAIAAPKAFIILLSLLSLWDGTDFPVHRWGNLMSCELSNLYQQYGEEQEPESLSQEY